MSDRVEVLLTELLDQPATTPYGNPLSADRAPAPDQANLVRALAAAHPITGRPDWIGEPLQADPDALARLRRDGVMPGSVYTLSTHGPAVHAARPDGVVIAIPHDVTAHLFVTEL
ncbi:hypothetical protein GCM10022288_30720 [Gryllotalpicola kribbensis]|jgi:DtxR family Mn-dependent transcriptional regulator|uniref:2-keto-4-pentenoate hydratase n=1 Tax=Gryllotalpicola kribbensis TaxID=993084 RepID=A0ABP8B079_9MICO